MSWREIERADVIRDRLIALFHTDDGQQSGIGREDSRSVLIIRERST